MELGDDRQCVFVSRRCVSPVCTRHAGGDFHPVHEWSWAATSTPWKWAVVARGNFHWVSVMWPCLVKLLGLWPSPLTDWCTHNTHTRTHRRWFQSQTYCSSEPPPPSKASTLHPPSYLPFILFQSVLALQPFISFLTSQSGPHHSFFCWIAPSLTHNLKSKVKHGGVLPSSSSWPWLAGVELSYHRRTADEWLEQSSTLLSGCFTLNAAGHSHADVIVQKLKGADELAKERKGNYDCMIRVNI